MPGSGKQPQHVQENIKQLLEAGFDPTTIHKRLKVGRSSVYRMKKSLQQYGTAYAPPDTNKKNGRPKVLAPEQELAVRDWLRSPANRDRYLDDLVWYIHDQFNVVCSTTTVSKMKRKWLRVIEDCERNGRELPTTLPSDFSRHTSREASPSLLRTGMDSPSQTSFPPPALSASQRQSTSAQPRSHQAKHRAGTSASPQSVDAAIHPDLQQHMHNTITAQVQPRYGT